MLAGKSGAATITVSTPRHFTTHFALRDQRVRSLNYMDRKQAQRIDRFAQFALAAAPRH